MLYLTVYHNEECIKTYEFLNVPLTIGRLPENDVSIASISISRRHLTIEKDSTNNYHIKDLNSLNGTFVNNKRITHTILQHNDKITIGKYSVIFELTESTVPIVEFSRQKSVTEPPENPEPRQTIQSQQSLPSPLQEPSEPSSPEPPNDKDDFQENRTFLPVLIEIDKHIIYKIEKTLMSIGNSEQDDIFIDGFMISDEHVLIEKNEEGIWIYSNKLISRFKVNGKKTNRHKLQHKDKIEIGSNTFRYMEHGQK